IKLALVTHAPINLAELYKSLCFDYVFGTECELKKGAFTGKVLKMAPNKGAIVKNLSGKLGIKLNECIAVGDSKADIPMFESVGYDNSFAINANEEVKKHAKHHIKDFKEIMKICF
ncbi:MAG: HAD hydrolase family protein, partial [Nanoarchaeota archaeon]